MASTITVVVKNDEKTLKSKHLVYDKFMCDPNDQFLRSLIDLTVKDFGSDPDDVSIKISIDNI